jgi:L-proline amide hydrolase
MIRDGNETWYRVVGDLDAGPTPVVICHGGPGAAHDYTEPIANLSRYGRACVLYDQVGCGNSTHLPDAPADFWTVQLFKDELVDLTRHLGIADRYAVVGQSWGGMLGMEHAIDHPAGLRGLVVADSPASIPLWVAEANRLRADLPVDVQETLTKHEADGTTDSEEYEAATRVFYDRHLCRVAWPDYVERSFAKMAEDPTVYHTMNGPSEFHCIGSAVGWDVTSRLPEIANPVLIVSGRYDEAGLPLQETLLNGLKTAELTVFGESSHMPHWEERDRYMNVVGGWLGGHDVAVTRP